jgi:hypothetical protein
MQIPVLIEPTQGGGFQARAGEPFSVSATGVSPQEAAERLATLLRERLKAGARVGLIDLANGPQIIAQVPLHLEPLPEDEWFFQTMREAIAENRQREDEADQ